MNTKEPEEYRRERLAARAAKYTTNVDRLRAIRNATLAELCAHHVPATNCNDCARRVAAERSNA